MPMTELQRHQFKTFCEALYRKERNEMRDQDGCEMQKAETNSEQAEPGVTISRSAARTAIRQAEQAVDEINARLRDAEQQRDDLARQLGAQQDMVDRLLGEREYRARHVRNLQAAAS